MNTLYMIILLVSFAAFTEQKVAANSTVSMDDEQDNGFQISNTTNELINAIKRDDVSKIRSLISEGMNMSNKIDNGQTAMHIAAEEGNIGMIKLLLDDGVSPNIVDYHFSTPFHVTAQTGRVDIAQILIESGAKINARNIQAWTPLHYAALWGHAKFIELLISCGADVDVYDLNGCTPLHIAALNGKVDAVQRLIEFGAYIFANDNKGLTPYDYARLSSINYLQMLAILKENEMELLAKLLVLVLLFGFMTASLLVVFNQIYTSLQFYNRLRKGDSIGHGHFSDVYKGELLPINPLFRAKRVAIKSVKNCNETDSKLTGTTELLAEINIVKRLPKHPNVVRFIGAVTENPLEGEIKIVYEFCPYGDLKSFLKKNRQSAVDQKQTTSSQCGSKANATGVYGAKAERIDEEEGSPLTPTYPFTTTDLLNWSAQVAKGLQFLASNDPPIIHRDLAARNILLCENKVVKIGDFGLSRRLNGSYVYVKTSWAPDPLRWMAIESLPEEDEPKFSVKSDVWSFGVVLWELFSEGDDPYYISKEDLSEGVRLKRPKKATKEMYDLMMSCWEENPEDRPSFDKLEEMLSQIYLNALNGDGDNDEDKNEDILRSVRVDDLKFNDRASLISDVTEESCSISDYNSP